MVEVLNIALARRQIDGAGIWRGIEKISRGEGPAGVFASLGPSPVFIACGKPGKRAEGTGEADREERVAPGGAGVFSFNREQPRP